MPPVKYKKKQTRRRQRRLNKNTLKKRNQANKIRPWIIVGSTIGFFFLWLGIGSIPIFIVLLFLGINPFIQFSLPIVFILLGILLLCAALKASSRAFDKDPNIIKRKKRTFGIINLVTGATVILISLSFLLIALIFFIGIINVSAFAFPLIGFILGTYMVLNGVPLIDESYGTYTKDEDIHRMRQKKRLIFGWIGFVLLGLTSIVLFLLSTWTIALIVLAAAIALCLSNLLLLRALK